MPNPLTSPEGTMVLPIESELFPEVEPTAQPRIVASPAANSFHSDPTQAVPVAAPQQPAAGWFARRRAAAATAPPSADGADVSSAPAAKTSAVDRTLVAEHHADSTVTWDPEPTRIAQIEEDETMMLSLDSSVEATFRRPLPDAAERE